MKNPPKKTTATGARILINRVEQTGKSTRSVVTVFDRDNLTVFKCAGLELPWLGNKKRVSRIPAGVYRLTYRTWGRFFQRYAKKYGHKFVLEIAKITGRSDVLIHIGNKPADTLGCPLVGRKITGMPDFVGRSEATYLKFIEAVELYRPKVVEVKDPPHQAKTTPDKSKTPARKPKR